MIIGLFHGYGAGYYRKFGRVTEFLIASLFALPGLPTNPFVSIKRIFFAFPYENFMNIQLNGSHWLFLSTSFVDGFMNKHVFIAYEYWKLIEGTNFKYHQMGIQKEFSEFHMDFWWVFWQCKPKNFIQSKWKTFNFE